MRPTELSSLDLGDFLDMVEGALLWEDDLRVSELGMAEYTLDWLSFFAANIMISSGNYKKPDVLEMKKGLFQTQAEVAAEQAKDFKKDVESEKAKLAKIFNLDVETI